MQHQGDVLRTLLNYLLEGVRVRAELSVSGGNGLGKQNVNCSCVS